MNFHKSTRQFNKITTQLKMNIKFEQTLHQKDIKMANEPIKKYSISVNNRELQIKTTVRNHYVSIRNTMNE